MRYRKLRLAWSVGCGIVCLLLIGLWVRSYWHIDALHVRPLIVASGLGELIFSAAHDTESLQWQTAEIENKADWLNYPWGFGYASESGYHELALPHWFAVILVSILTTLSWLHWRFSLRTLLIGMTMLAVVLGLVVWSMR